MNIDRAIELLEHPFYQEKLKPYPETMEATRLGIEALKQVKESRFDPSTWEPKALPGETK